MVVAPVRTSSNGLPASSPQERIPAWKRLGLKLKNANDTEDVVASNDTTSRRTLKRASPDTQLTASITGSIAEPQAKKRRVDFHADTSTERNAKLARGSDTFLKDRIPGLKKKVSFTAETKLEDGGKELITDWEEDNYAYYEQKAAENDAKEALEKSKNSTVSLKKTFGTSRKSEDALDYLNLYYSSRSSWKFNKNREVWILRHILSLDEIPTSFNNALASYVHGLGSRQARSRLVDQCQQALAKEGPEQPYWDRQHSDLGHMEDPNRRKAYHDDAVRRFKRSLEAHVDDAQRKADENDPEYQRWLSRRKRAEILLWAATPTTSNTDEASISSREVRSESQSSTTVKSAGGGLSNGHLFNRKKKNRTAVVEVTSSSEDESGNSGSESDGSELENAEGLLNGVTETSSSANESSSATSISESDSESGAESATIANRLTDSAPSSDDESEAHKRHVFRRPQPSILMNSRSNTSPIPISSASDDTSSSGSTESDDEQDESDSGFSTEKGNTGSGMSGNSGNSGNSGKTSSSDEEDNSQSDSD